MNDYYAELLAKIEDKIQKSLPKNSDASWQKNSFGALPESVKASHLTPLLEPTRSLVDLGGKRWRPLFLVLCAQAASSSEKKDEATELALSLAPLVEFVHTASLIHDDIEDSSESRRGQPAAYLTYGTDVAINAGSWLYFHAGTCIKSLNCSDELKIRLYEIYLEELRRLHLGQAMDIAWHKDNDKFPLPEEYIAMVKNKTGTLASLAAKIGCLAANADKETVAECGEIASDIGAGFQIIDDVINLTSGNPGKKRGDDIVEGKKSLITLIFAEENKNNPQKIKQLQEYFVQASKEGIESPAVEKAISLLNENDSILKAKKEGIKYINESCEKIMKLFNSNKNESELICSLFKKMIPSDFKENA